jgi:hypothetical protein
MRIAALLLALFIIVVSMVAPLGAGSMGEIYRARDSSWGVTWLGRNVSNSVEPLGGTNEIRAHEMCLMTTPWILAAIRLRYNRRQRWLI